MDQLQLSNDVIQAVKDALLQHDERVKDDLILVQYLAALVGYVLANQGQIPAGERSDILKQMIEFIEYVFRDMMGQSEQAVQPDSQEAFGIWKPGDP